MKKIITMVGTSILENLIKKEGCKEAEEMKRIKNEIANLRYYENKNDDQKMEKCKRLTYLILDAYKKCDLGREDEEIYKISAELKSLNKIKEELREDIIVYLLCSDTLVGYACAKALDFIIKDLRILEDVYVEPIEGIQVSSREDFERGMGNLVEEVYRISQHNWTDIIFNMTGGFKATIPFVTMLAQLNGCPIYYIFENTDGLIKIPKVPISREIFDLKLVGKFIRYFEELYDGIDSKERLDEIMKTDFYKHFSFAVWTSDIGLAELNAIGRMILEKYKEKNQVDIYVTDEVVRYLKNNPRLMKVFKKFVIFVDKTHKKVELKNGHRVYDDGSNQYRIYFFEESKKVYVYKVFCNHDESDRFLEERFDRKKYLVDTFKPYKEVLEYV
ncbi:MAG: putative CRISPR-associated protein [Spirochaetia bacterium]|nr:putative CRISPR-associated protein [Spirochaetota bacterium]MDW8113256.1 putative CRISPR-associated protein [Spirochaetia bacterium]